MRSSVGFWWVILLFLLFFSGCRSKEKVALVAVLPHLSDRQILQNLEDSSFHFDHVFFKKVAIDFEDNKQNISFKANVFLHHDSCIILSIAPAMGIELYRILLEPGGVKILDRLNREVTVSGYEAFNSRFMVQLDYPLIQSILTNRLFSYPPDSDKGVENYQGKISGSGYLLSSVNQRKLQRLYQHSNDRDLILHQILVDPTFFRVKENKILDVGGGLNVDIAYLGFQPNCGAGCFFPDQMVVKGSKADRNFKVSIKFGDVDFDGQSKISFKVPDKYETVYR